MQLMENNFVKKSSLRYPKERHVSSNKLQITLKTNLFARHSIEKLKDSFLTPLKLPFESTYQEGGAGKISLQTELLKVINLKNVVFKTTNEEKLNVDLQHSILLTDSNGTKRIILPSLIKYNLDDANSYFDILNKSENYMDFESSWYDVNTKPLLQVPNYKFNINKDCQALLTYMKNINQNCANNLDQNYRRSFSEKQLYPVNRNSSSSDLKCKIRKSENFETYKAIVKDTSSTELKLSQNRTQQNVMGKLCIGIDQNLHHKYLTNSNRKFFITNCQCIPKKDSDISDFAQTLLSSLDNTQNKKKSNKKSKTEYKMITDANENNANDEINNLKTKIEEIKEQLPLNSPIDALLEVCGPKSHITNMILNKDHKKKVIINNKNDSRFRTVRKISNTDSFSQNNLICNDECLKLDYRNVSTPTSSKQSERSNSRPNSPYFEIDNFYVSNNSLDYLQNQVHVALKSNVDVIETLYNLRDNVMHMENNLLLFHQYICSIKSEIGHLIFKHTCKQTNISELLKLIESESKQRNLSSTKCNELLERYSELESSSSTKKIETKSEDSTQMCFPFKFQMALSAIFLIGFICGDFVK